MATKLSKLLALSWNERFLLWTSAVALLACRLLLLLSETGRARRGTRHLVRLLGPFVRVEDPDRIAWAVTCASTHLPGRGTCLAQAIVGEALLSVNGYQVTVRLGVRNGDETFKAHAWVEHRGSVIIGNIDGLDRYRRLTTL